MNMKPMPPHQDPVGWGTAFIVAFIAAIFLPLGLMWLAPLFFFSIVELRAVTAAPKPRRELTGNRRPITRGSEEETLLENIMGVLDTLEDEKKLSLSASATVVVDPSAVVASATEAAENVTHLTRVLASYDKLSLERSRREWVNTANMKRGTPVGDEANETVRSLDDLIASYNQLEDVRKLLLGRMERTLYGLVTVRANMGNVRASEDAVDAVFNDEPLLQTQKNLKELVAGVTEAQKVLSRSSSLMSSP